MNDFSDELLSAYLDDELSSDERAHVEAAMEADPELRRMCDELRALSSTLQAMPTAKPQDDWAETVLQRVGGSASESADDSASSPFAVATTTINNERSKLPLYVIAGAVGSLAAIVLVMVAISGSSRSEVATSNAEADAMMAPYETSQAKEESDDVSAGVEMQMAPMDSAPMTSDAQGSVDEASPPAASIVAPATVPAPTSLPQERMVQTPPTPAAPNASAADAPELAAGAKRAEQAPVVMRFVIERGSPTDKALQDALTSREKMREFAKTSSVDRVATGVDDLVRKTVSQPVLSNADEVFVVKTDQQGLQQKLAALLQQPLLEKALKGAPQTRAIKDRRSSETPSPAPAANAAKPDSVRRGGAEPSKKGPSAEAPSAPADASGDANAFGGGGAGGRAASAARKAGDIIYRADAKDLLQRATSGQADKADAREPMNEDRQSEASPEHLIIIVQYSDSTQQED